MANRSVLRLQLQTALFQMLFILMNLPMEGDSFGN